MVETDKLLEVIHQIDKLMNGHINSIKTLLSNSDLKSICADHEHLKSLQTNAGFNIFHLISDTYYKENFHSDIVAAFLDRTGKHNAGDKYLKEFIKLINKLLTKNNKQKIDIYKFTDTVVERETGKIDICIRDEISHQAIIVENKINNANDTERQLPKYCNYIKSKRYEVVAIVYLPLDKNKRPVEIGWKDEEKKFIHSKLIKLVAYDETEYDLFSGWLRPCITLTNEIDALSILRQYSRLIQNLGGNNMNKKLFDDFYNKVIKETENYKTALGIKSIVDEIPEYLALRIVDEFINDYSPFTDIHTDHASALFITGKVHEHNFRIRIECAIDKYTFRFWDENFLNDGLKYAEKVIEHFGYVGFNKNEKEKELTKDLKFEKEELPKGEKILYQFIKDFIEKLKNLPIDFFVEK